MHIHTWNLHIGIKLIASKKVMSEKIALKFHTAVELPWIPWIASGTLQAEGVFARLGAHLVE